MAYNANFYDGVDPREVSYDTKYNRSWDVFVDGLETPGYEDDIDFQQYKLACIRRENQDGHLSQTPPSDNPAWGPSGSQMGTPEWNILHSESESSRTATLSPLKDKGDGRKQYPPRASNIPPPLDDPRLSFPMSQSVNISPTGSTPSHPTGSTPSQSVDQRNRMFIVCLLCIYRMCWIDYFE